MARRHRQRRGIVLLIILTLLTLLIVVGLTFALLSGQFRRGADASARKDRYGDPPSAVLERALYQLVRDTNDATSSIRSHSLLRDMYGESVRGRQTSAMVDSGGGQFLEFSAELALDANGDGSVTHEEVGQGLRTNGFFNGCVLTFLTGPLRNVSTRVVGYQMDVSVLPPVAQFRILRPACDNLSLTVPSSEFNNLFLVNGRAFVGTGAGYVGDVTNPDYGTLTRAITIGSATCPHALLPHRFNESPIVTSSNYLEGGLNEGYDAADYQNMALAALVPDPTTGQLQVLPSFHQVPLINYWANHSAGVWDPANPAYSNPAVLGYRDFRRRVVFRPMPWDHPNFDGGNPAFAAAGWDPGPDGTLGTSDDVLTNDTALTAALINGPWDVDCDGDGVRDAVWVDLGFPLQTDPSGRRYKPLFAILCTDLDGKLNLNAHGNLSHVAPLAPALPVTLPSASGPIPSEGNLPRGQGYGPPEITLAPLFSSAAEYRALLQGNAANGLPGRYGLNMLPGDDGIQILAQVKLFEYPPALLATSPANYFLPNTPLSAFSSPFDLRGEFALGLDYRGQLLYERSTEPNLVINSAYEADLSGKATSGFSLAPVPDLPFSAAEFERLLRSYDVDVASLPDRLWHLVDVFRNDPGARRAVTFASYDPPSPGILAWPELRDELRDIGMDRLRHIVDLVRARMIDARSLQSQLDQPAVIARLNKDLASLLSPDMVMGLRFDVNRPFGNGQDDPSPVTGELNQVVDDHGVGANDFRGEDATDERFWGGIPFDHDNDGIVGNDGDAFRARHLYAKRLYVLMMAIKPPDLQIDFDGDPSNDCPDETAYGIAQWAVNVVDFRDADSIMTPFEFDINPFNQGIETDYGWEVDGILGTGDDSHPERGLVWGCERPELLITEAFALHDRRTEDLAVGDKTTDGDVDFDQRLAPRGSFFLELYNPWAGDERLPGEFYYDSVNGGWASGVMLNQVTQGPTNRFPVWRVLIAKGENKHLDPDHWDAAQRMPTGAVERTVYFTPFPGPAVGTALTYYTDLPVAPILPGRYAVVGSAGQTVDESGRPLDLDGDGVRDFITTIGRRVDALEDGMGGLNYAGTRRIVLEPSLNVGEHQAQVLGNLAPIVEPVPPDIQPAVGVVINLPSSLNVSEPLVGYPATGPNLEVWDPAGADYEGAYSPPLTSPLDVDSDLLEDKTTDDYCFVHLQRLANPLLPYDAVLNPYLTIDSMSCDLTAFNGVTSDIDPNAGSQELRMTTRERGRSLDVATMPRALWKHEPGAMEPGGMAVPASVAETIPIHFQDQVLGHTLGYLNRAYGEGYTAATAPVPDSFPGPLLNRPSTFYIGAPVVNPASPDPLYQHPFPWLTWLNRPFVSEYELMLVPKSRSSRLAYDYSLMPPSGPVYEPDSPGYFGHLLNFFQTSDETSDNEDFYRLFELVRVPSRFVNTDLYLNPNQFAGTSTAGTGLFHPPFNRISQYRDPGRINLNTIYYRGVWNGVLAGHDGGSGWDWEDLVRSRRGYDAAAGDVFELNAAYPSFFTNPFRPAGAGRLVPPTTSAARLDRPDIETTLLRSRAIGNEDPEIPLWRNSSDQVYNNTDRNPYFRYQGIDRLGNLVTTRSNVYAVWITMGYFEAEPSPTPVTPEELRAHPDGYRLGKELGSDTGNIKRHRAFYLIDRSIPVAFEPGENHNVDRAIVLRRFIE